MEQYLSTLNLSTLGGMEMGGKKSGARRDEKQLATQQCLIWKICNL